MLRNLIKGFLIALMLAASVPLSFAQRRAYGFPPPGSFYAQQREHHAHDHNSHRDRKGDRGGWQRFGDPGGGDSLRQRYRRNPNDGWHRFGSPERQHRQQHHDRDHRRGHRGHR